MGKSEDYLEEFLKEMDEPLDTEIDFDEDLLDEDLLDEDLSDEDLLDEDLSDEDLQDEYLLDEDLLDEDLPGQDMLGEDFPLNEDLQDDGLSEDYLNDFQMALQEVNEKNELHDRNDEAFLNEVFDNLDSIVSGKKDVNQISDSDFNVEEFSYDDFGTDVLSALQSSSEETALETPSEIMADILPDIVSEEPQMDDTEADVMKILEGLGDLDLELEMETETGSKQSEETKANDDALLDFLASSAMADTADSTTDTPDTADVSESKGTSKDNKKKSKSGKNVEKKGFFSKLGTILFGEEEEAEEPVKETAQVSDNILEKAASGQELANDTLDLFKDFTPTTSGAEKEVAAEQEEDKKKKKKDKKEKVKKEKKPKPKKEKKPKKPKEPDNTPPLPKKPVMLILLMVASFVVLIILGTNLLGYSNALTNAKNAFTKKNYAEAYSYVSGMEIKEKDIPLYEKYQTVALISSEYDAYKHLMAAEMYDMAFDSLIRMVGRCDKFREDAMNYGCINELNALEADAESILNETFKMSKEEAIELYNYRDRRDYTNALNAILKKLGMEKVIEE